MSYASTIATWTRSSQDEQAMEEGHAPLWTRLIELMTEPSLQGMRVLDYGCNQGGFLRLLHSRKGFREAVGCDLAAESVAIARARQGSLPIQYIVGTDLATHAASFDVAFSHEVIYLIPDIADHARAIHAALRPGGVYYAVTGCHTDNPQWAAWREDIAARSNVPPVDRSIDDYVRAFAGVGFTVTVRKFGLDTFMPVRRKGELTDNIVARLNYFDNVKMCFRLIKDDLHPS